MELRIDFDAATSLLQSSLIILVSMVICLTLLKYLRRIGRNAGLVDRPSGRKIHRGNIPLVGGLSIFGTLLIVHAITPVISTTLMLASILMVLVGVVDDYKEVRPSKRLVFQCLSAASLVIFGGYQILSLGPLVTHDAILLSGILCIAFSVFCIVGVINAINMIDGADCLAGGVVTISLTGLLVASAQGPSALLALDTGLLVVLGATFGFLLMNSGLLGRRRKVFLGDSGSMFLGLFLAAHFIGATQGEEAHLSPVAAGWLFGLPLLDSIAVMTGRVLRGNSPFAAGRDHLHHLLLDAGISRKWSVGGMLVLHLAMVCVGLLGNHFNISMPVMFWGFVVLTILHLGATPRLIRQVQTSFVTSTRLAEASKG